MNRIPVFGTEASVPLSCGGLVFDFIREFKDPGLGVAFRYVGPDRIYADAYLYDFTLPSISQDIRSKGVRQEFQDAYASILVAVERGDYHCFETHKSEFLHIPDDDPEPFCLWSAFSYYIYSEYSKSDEDFTKRRTSHLTLRTDRGFINKVRYTYPSYKDMTEQTEFAGFAGFIAFLLEWTKTVRNFSSDRGIAH